MKPARNRKELVTALVRYELPIEPVAEGLALFGWDSADELVQVGPDDLLAILDRYLRNELSAEQVTDWANRLEVREDVGAESPNDAAIRDVIFRLANPRLEGAITPDLARGIRAELLGLGEGAG